MRRSITEPENEIQEGSGSRWDSREFLLYLREAAKRGTAGTLPCIWQLHPICNQGPSLHGKGMLPVKAESPQESSREGELPGEKVSKSFWNSGSHTRQQVLYTFPLFTSDEQISQNVRSEGARSRAVARQKPPLLFHKAPLKCPH